MSFGKVTAALRRRLLANELRLFFMHFWAHDDAGKLAKGLRHALDHLRAAKN